MGNILKLQCYTYYFLHISCLVMKLTDVLQVFNILGYIILFCIFVDIYINLIIMQNLTEGNERFRVVLRLYYQNNLTVKLIFFILL